MKFVEEFKEVLLNPMMENADDLSLQLVKLWENIKNKLLPNLELSQANALIELIADKLSLSLDMM